jgi:hypothetical protein
MTSAIIDLLAVEAVFLTAFTGIISASMWHRLHIDSVTHTGETFARPLSDNPRPPRQIHRHG